MALRVSSGGTLFPLKWATITGMPRANARFHSAATCGEHKLSGEATNTRCEAVSIADSSRCFPIDAWPKLFHIQPGSHISLDERERQGFSEIVILA